MALNAEALKALEAMLGGATANAGRRNGRSVKPASDKPQLVPASLAELLANKPTASVGEDIPESAVTGTANGKTVAIYPATIYGVTAVKVKGMPFKKDFFSLDTIKLMASDEFHILLNEFLEQIPS